MLNLPMWFTTNIKGKIDYPGSGKHITTSSLLLTSWEGQLQQRLGPQSSQARGGGIDTKQR